MAGSRTVRRVPGPDGAPAGRSTYWLEGPSDPLETARIPVIVHRGSRPSPSVAVVAGVHGDEVEGIRALHQLDAELRSHPPTGSVLLIPMANPAAFRGRARQHPADLGDLNRSFPGDDAGSPTMRLAAVLFEAVAGWEFVLSLHSWFGHGVVAPYVEAPAGEREVDRLSRSVASRLGLEHVRLSDWHPGLLVAASLARGTPAIEVEVGGLGRLSPEWEGRYLEVCRRAFAALGVAFGPAAEPASRTVRHHYVSAGTGGFFVREAGLRQQVTKGQPLGKIVNPMGRLMETIRAVADGTIAGFREHPAVHAGDDLFYVFVPADH
jgi:predicted deacylase